jgi:hypothetical protein
MLTPDEGVTSESPELARKVAAIPEEGKTESTKPGMKPQEVVKTAIEGAMKTKLKTADGKQITKDRKVSPLATQR